MNLIEIAEQLKDVPDQYLMQEVQQPTGNYPAYLVISELGRRKRMRDSAMKEMPKTTVAQDLTAPQRQQAMAQGQNMVQQAGGLNAMPQAQQDLAAMDMLSAQPQMAQMPQEIPAMAGGGMVSFSNGGRTYVDEFSAYSDALGTGDSYTSAGKLPPEIEAYRPGVFGTLFGLMPEGVGSGNIDYSLGQLGYTRQQIMAMDPAMKRYVVAKVEEGRAPQAATPTTQPTTKPPPAPSGNQPPRQEQRVVPTAPFGLPSETNLAAAEKAGIEAYKQAMPDRLAEFRADLANQQKGMEARRASNLNEALIAAGLGIMGSKSPRALQAIGEGGMSGLSAYRQGVKDLRDSENALRESRLAMAKAQMLEDQGSFKAGKDARKEAIDLATTAANLRNTESSIYVREKTLPAQIAVLNAQAEAYRNRGAPKELSAADRKLFQMDAIARLKRRGISDPSDAQIDAEIAILRGLGGAAPVAPSGDYSALMGT